MRCVCSWIAELETDLLHEVIGWSFYLLLFAVFICFVWGMVFLG